MSDDLVKRLRVTCICDIYNTPCLAEEECRAAQEAADRIEELEAKLSESEALLAKAVEALGWVKFGGGPRGEGYHEFVCTILAELKGQDDV